jgi:hypothetical protein
MVDYLQVVFSDLETRLDPVDLGGLEELGGAQNLEQVPLVERLAGVEELGIIPPPLPQGPHRV